MTTLRIKENIPLAPMTTFKIGGRASYFADIQTEEELKAAVQFAQAKGLPLFVLGGGSNVLIGDDGFSGLVLKIGFRGIREIPDDTTVDVIAGAGEGWDHLVTHAVTRGYAGIESLALIPGTVGGAVVQNIGAYGSEVASVITSVAVYDTKENVMRTLTREQCEFGYRDSVFKHKSKDCVVVRATFRLPKNGTPHSLYKDVAETLQKKGISSPTIEDVRDTVIEIRTAKLPNLEACGTAGSFFKNPTISKAHFDTLKQTFPDMPGFPTATGLIKVPLAWILDHVCHLKGFTHGSVSCHEHQPLVLVAHGDAEARHVLALANEIRSRVFDATKITIDPEVVFVSCDM